MAFNISYLFQAIDKYTRPARNILQSTKRLEKGFAGLNRVVKLGAELQRKSAFIMAGTDLAIVGMATGILRTASTFQQLNMSFHSMMDNQKDATTLFGKMIDMSQKFGAATTIELSTAARGFLAVGASAKDIPIVLSRLMDLSAQTGVSLVSLAYGYQQTFATQVVRKRYIRSLSNATPLLANMAAVLHKTTKETQHLLNHGKIAFVTLAKAIKRMTDAGGKFFQGQKRGANTLRGAFKVVQDSVQVLMFHMGMFLAQQFHITQRAFAIRDAIMKVNASFSDYAKKYGGLVKAIIEGLVAFAALVTFNFLLGTLMRSVVIVLWLYRGAVLAVKGAVILWRGATLALALAEGIALAPLLIFVTVMGLVLYGIYRLLKTFHLWRATMVGLGQDVTNYLIHPFDHLICKIKEAIKAIQKFMGVSSVMKKIEEPFAAVGKWIARKIPVPKHLYDVAMAEKMVMTTPLPSIYQIGAHRGMPSSFSQIITNNTSAGLVSALQQAFPNLNEGLQTQVHVTVGGHVAHNTQYTGHAYTFPNFDTGLNMPQAAGGSA